MRKYRLGRIISVFRNVLRLPRTMRYNEQMRIATLHSVISDLDDIINKERERIDDGMIYTDELGSFWNPSINLKALVW